MKPNFLFHFFLGISLVIGHIGCSSEKKEQAAGTESAKPRPDESRIKQGTNGEVILTLTAATQQIMGLQTVPLASANLSLEVKGFGRVLEVSPLAGLVSEIAANQAASDASEAELKRMKTLAAQTNASERALQNAVVAVARDRAQVQSNRQRLLAGWGSAIAQRQDLPALVQSLVSQESALVQIDLPAGEWPKELPTGARIVLLTDETKPVEAELIAPAPSVDPQVQGRGFLFLVATNQSRLVPGAAITGYLKFPGNSVKGVVAPESAVVRHVNKAWVYVQKDGSTFVRQEVQLNHPFANGWFITVGLQPNDRIVVGGAQSLLSEELKSQTRLAD
jgi:hypothetical protein